MEGERETWKTEEFGASHEGAVGVLAEDGTVPRPVYFDAGSSGNIQSVSHWSVYDGQFNSVRAASLRGVCSCGWTGTEYPLDWDEIGDEDLADAGARLAEKCTIDWDDHTEGVAAAALPLPEPVTALLEELSREIEKLTKSSPLAAVRAVRRLEVAAVEVGYWAAREVRGDATAEEAAAALGLDEDAARSLLARLGRWSPYS
ncbi:hypothetical protein ACIQNU_03550 [Streptomyces sp. NPDC091292]|uniref:hypothetical protein n=1 Tax=Streptomyces sp. NPDC091292 TaxID=3365991 RepID=UPI003815DB2E